MIFDAVFVVHTYVIVLLWFIRMYIDILHSCLELMILCRTCSTSDPAARARAHTYTHTYKHKTHTHTHNTLSLTHTRTHTYNTHTHTHTNTHTHTHTHTRFLLLLMFPGCSPHLFPTPTFFFLPYSNILVIKGVGIFTSCSVLQCVALCCLCCTVLRCVAVCCSMLQYVAVCYNMLKYVAVCCSILQCGGLINFALTDYLTLSSPVKYFKIWPKK